MEKSFSSKIGVLLAAAGSAGMVKDPMSVSRIIRGIPVYYLPPDESEEGLSSLLQAVKTRFTQKGPGTVCAHNDHYTNEQQKYRATRATETCNLFIFSCLLGAGYLKMVLLWCY